MIQDANPPASPREGPAGLPAAETVQATWDSVVGTDTAPLPQLELAAAYDASLAEDGPMPVAPEEDEEAVFVFLGGACNPTTWRHNVAMPRLEEAGVSYFNPQVKEWSPELIEIERNHKESAEVRVCWRERGEGRASGVSCPVCVLGRCALTLLPRPPRKVLLFVINMETHGVVSMQEAAEFIVRGRSVVLMLEDLKPPATGEGEDAQQAAERAVESLDKLARQDALSAGTNPSLQPVVEEGEAMGNSEHWEGRKLAYGGERAHREEEAEEKEGREEQANVAGAPSPASTAGLSSEGDRGCRVALYTEEEEDEDDDDDNDNEDEDEVDEGGSSNVVTPSPPAVSSSPTAQTPGHASMQTQPGSAPSVSTAENGGVVRPRLQLRAAPTAANTPRAAVSGGVLDTPRSTPPVLMPRAAGAQASPATPSPLARDISHDSLSLQRNVSLGSHSSSGSSTFFARHALLEGLETATHVVKEAVTEIMAYKKAVVKDVNRGREYLRELAERHGARVFDSVEDAVEHVVSLYHDVEQSSAAGDVASGGVGEGVSGASHASQGGGAQTSPGPRSPPGAGARKRSASSGAPGIEAGGGGGGRGSAGAQDGRPPLSRPRRASASPGGITPQGRQRRHRAPQGSPSPEHRFPAARALAAGAGGGEGTGAVQGPSSSSSGRSSSRSSPPRGGGGQGQRGTEASSNAASSGPGGVWV